MRNFRRLVRELRPYWKVLAGTAVLTLFTALLGLPSPIIVAYLVDHLYKHQHVNLLAVFLAFVGVAIASGIVGYALTTAVTYLGQRFKYDMRRKLYAHMQTLSLGFFEKAQTGKLMSNITSDVSALDQLISGGFVRLLQDTATLAGVLLYVFGYDWRLAAVGLAVYPLYVGNYLLHIGKIKHTADEVREDRDIMLGDLQEKLAGAL